MGTAICFIMRINYGGHQIAARGCFAAMIAICLLL